MDQPHYRSVAVASTFSPRFLRVLAEGQRIGTRFSTLFSLIYVGEKNAKASAKFSSAFKQLGLPADSAILYEQGEPAEAILRAAEKNKVDLIVAGALEKQVVLRSFIGKVARQLIESAPCSVMLFTQPEEKPKPLRQIVLLAEFNERGLRALRKTLHLAASEKSERLHVIRVYTTFDEARAKRRGPSPEAKKRARTLDEERAALEEFILSAGPTDVPIEAHCVRGNTTYAAFDFVHAMKANLLAVPLPPPPGPGKKFPARLAWITDVIPCNLWVIR